MPAPRSHFWTLDELLARTERAENGCLEWQGSKTKQGYGNVGSRRWGNYLVHRLVYALSNEPIPEGMEVCHACDNPACVERTHLFLGSHADNMADARRKQRASKPPRHLGSTHPQARLGEDDVRYIRQARGVVSRQSLAERFDVSRSTISAIWTGENWGWLA